jgi:modification methylase
MQTIHKIHFELAQKMDAVKDSSIELVVTSPPYPMIEM